MTNQQHVIMLDELEVGELEFISDKFDLDAEGIMIGTLKILQDKDSQKPGLRNPVDDNNVSVIMFNMLSVSQVCKEVDSHVHEDLEDDNGITDDSDHDIEDVKTLVNEAICKNQSILLDYGDDMSPHNNEDLSLINKDEEKSVSEVTRNMLNKLKDCMILIVRIWKGST